MTHRRVLLVAYHFRPTASVGSVRAGGLAKYLPRFGWEPTVVTPRQPGRSALGIALVETEDADFAAGIKRALGWPAEASFKDLVGARASGGQHGLRGRIVDQVKGAVAIPDTNRGWIPIAVDACRRAAAGGGYDALLTTSPPVSAHVAGMRIKQALGLPWVADLRDLWASDRNSTAPAWRRSLDRRIERSTLGSADGLVTVSEPLARELRETYPRIEVRSILNGFDPDLSALARGLTPEFTLTHTGTFYQGRRDPGLLFEAVRRLIGNGRIPRERIRIRLFARHEPWVAALAERHGLAEVVSVLPWGPWERALEAQQESQVLLLFHWGGEREAGVYTGKVFEYLAARRPILMVGGGEGVLADLLRETGAGVRVTDRESLESVLLSWWEEFRATGAVAYRGNEASLSRLSHLRMAEEFAEVLDRAARRGADATRPPNL